MTDDLVNRAREFCIHTPLSKRMILLLADRIEQLEAENAELRNALQHEKERKRRAVDDALAHLRQDTGER